MFTFLLERLLFSKLKETMQWLRLYATSRKVAGSRSDEVKEFCLFA
jgi:hypothetical protein